MTFEEAKKKMAEGYRMTHQYFTEEEFFENKDGIMVCENGYNMARWYRGEEWQKSGWRIKQ